MTVISPRDDQMNLDRAQLAPAGSDQVMDVMSAQEGMGFGRTSPLTPDELGCIVDDIHLQPDWRKGADRDCDYYDNNQLSPDVQAEIERRGMLGVVRNLVQPTIDVVLGLEAKLRTDARCVADTDEYQDVAEALSKKLKEATREANTNDAIGDAFAGQVKAGIGWCEVTRASDPFAYPYETNAVHRREMYWKWGSEKPLLQDATFLLRRRFFDDTQVMAFFPRAAAAIQGMASGTPLDYWLRPGIETAQYGFEMGAEAITRWSMEEWEWRNTERQRLALFEIYYRRYVRGYVITNPLTGQPLELDLRNPLHKAVVASGQVKPKAAVYTKLRRAIYCGPARLYDGDVKSRRSPYVPFLAYREDLTGIPYGLIRTMISPQDEINARAQKMLWLLGAKRVTMDADALDPASNDVSDVMAEVSRADAVVILNPERRNRDRDAYYVDDNLALADAQYKVLQDNINTMQQVRGVFSAMLGSDSNATSGVAINSLIEQSTTVLSKVLSNYKSSKRAVHELVVELLSQDLSGQPVEILVSETGARRKTIILNQPVADPQTGMRVLKNDVSRANVKVAIEDVTASPAYRSQQLSMISEVIKGLPPEGQMVIAPAFIEATELPDRKKYADQLRKITNNVDPADMSPEEQQAFAQQQQQAAQMQQAMAEAQLAEQQAKANKLQAEAQVAMNSIASMKDGVDGKVKEAIDQVQQVAAKQITQLQAEVAQLKTKLIDRKVELATNHATAVHKARIDGTAKIEAQRIKAQSQAEAKQAATEFSRDLADIEQRLIASIQQVEDGMAKALDTIRSETREKDLQARESAVRVAANTSDTNATVDNDGAVEQRIASLAKVVEDVARSQEKMTGVVTELEQKISKPRKIVLEYDESGEPVGATSTVED